MQDDADFRGSRTRPWLLDEYMTVDGLRVVYTCGSAGFLVHMPGWRKSITPEEIKAQGRTVVLPRSVRKNNFA